APARSNSARPRQPALLGGSGGVSLQHRRLLNGFTALDLGSGEALESGVTPMSGRLDAPQLLPPVGWLPLCKVTSWPAWPTRPMSNRRSPPSLMPASEPRTVRQLRAADLNVVYQPIVNVGTGHTFALEALCRCKWPEFANPQVLFERAANENCCGQLGRSVREVAFEQVQDTPLFVNLHPHELSQHWLVRPDDPLFFHDQDVYLEITESAAFAYYDLCVNV